MKKIPKINRNIILSIFLLLGVAFSVVTIVMATAPDPGHNFTESSGGVVQGDLLYGSAADTLSALGKNITASRYLSNSGASNNPAWAQVDLTNGVTGALPNGNISSAGTWDAKQAGSSNLTSLSGLSYVSTAFVKMTGANTFSLDTNSYLANPMTTLGDIIYGGASGVATRLGGSAGFLKSTGAATPAWSTINLAADVGTSILPTANGGTGIAFFTAAGPTVARVFTFPDAAATVLTSNAAVTVAQGGTGLTASVADAVLVGDSTSAYTARTLPASCAGTTAKLLYDSTTNLFSCGTDQTGGGSTMTTVTTKNASGLGTGANAAVALASLTAYKVALFTIPYSITVNQLAYNVGVVTTAGTYRICVYNEAGTTKMIDVTDAPAAGVNTVAVGAVALTPGNYYIAIGCATTCNNTVFMFTSTANTMVNTSAVPTGKKEYEGLYTMTSGTCNATIDPTAFTGTISHTPVIRLDN